MLRGTGEEEIGSKIHQRADILSPRQTYHIVNEVVKQHRSIGENTIFPTPTEIHSMHRNLLMVLARQ
jgi:hypothetical protein